MYQPKRADPPVSRPRQTRGQLPLEKIPKVQRLRANCCGTSGLFVTSGSNRPSRRRAFPAGLPCREKAKPQDRDQPSKTGARRAHGFGLRGFAAVFYAKETRSSLNSDAHRCAEWRVCRPNARPTFAGRAFHPRRVCYGDLALAAFALNRKLIASIIAIMTAQIR